MAEVAPGAGEERLRGRPVHVDVLGVREDELGEAERVLLARLLAHVELPGRDLVEVLRRGGERGGVLVAARHDLHVLALEVGRVAPGVGHDLRADDARGRAPVGPEDHVLHLVDEDRRLVAERLADDDVHAQRARPAGRGRRPTGGTAARSRRCAAPCASRGASVRARGPARSARTRCAAGTLSASIVPRPDDAVRLEGVTALEALHRVHERAGVEGRAVGGRVRAPGRPRAGRRRRAAARRERRRRPTACPARPSSARRRAAGTGGGSPPRRARGSRRGPSRAGDRPGTAARRRRRRRGGRPRRARSGAPRPGRAAWTLTS